MAQAYPGEREAPPACACSCARTVAMNAATGAGSRPRGLVRGEMVAQAPSPPAAVRLARSSTHSAASRFEQSRPVGEDAQGPAGA